MASLARSEAACSRGRADAKRAPQGDVGGAAARAVCVTGGISFVGFAVIDHIQQLAHTHTYIKTTLYKQCNLQYKMMFLVTI
jgi:hypothetical protein